MQVALTEMTAGPHRGKVWRVEEMSVDEAKRRNAGMSAVQWLPTIADFEQLQREVTELKEKLAPVFAAHKTLDRCPRCDREFVQ